jgi:hypothetical protein
MSFHLVNGGWNGARVQQGLQLFDAKVTDANTLGQASCHALFHASPCFGNGALLQGIEFRWTATIDVPFGSDRPMNCQWCSGRERREKVTVVNASVSFGNV